MKQTITVVLMVLLGLLAGAGRAQEGRTDEATSLSAEQKAQVKAILSRYDASVLTAPDAHAINEAFRAAGLRNGPGLQQAIRDAGFVPERIGELDPPPGRGAGERRGEGRQGAGGGEDRPREEGAGGREGGGPPAGRGGEEQGGSRPGRGDREARGPGGGRGRRAGGYSLEQATSDRAQLTTIAFSGLAFLTGEVACNTFLPPGKVADYSGFQYMRDVDRIGLGHNTSFVPRVANSVLAVLTDAQKAQLVALGKEQEPLLGEFARKRFPLIKAFHRQLAGQTPAGSSGLSREAVASFAADLYEIDGRLSYRRAEVLGGIVRSLTEEQKARLGKMTFDDSSTWPDLPDQVDKRAFSHAVHVAVMTYASELFSWYAGNPEADTYFCPERHATYFGSFYMKDIPAMGNRGYSISTSLTGDSGEAFLAALDDAQRRLVTALVDQQRAPLAAIVRTRRTIATELRRFQTQPTADEARVRALSRRYGELDGEISTLYARAFAEVARTLTAAQKATLQKLRNLDPAYACRSAYLFSTPIPVPDFGDTDFLFGTGRRAPAGGSSYR